MRTPLFATLAVCLLITGKAYAVEKSAVLSTYADIAEAGYADSLNTAKVLGDAVDRLIAAPSAEALQAAKDAWRADRCQHHYTGAACRYAARGR